MNGIILSGMAWASSVASTIVNKIREQDGQDLVEYAVLAGVIGATLLTIGWVWTGIGSTFQNTIEGCIQFNTSACTLP